MNSHEKNKIPFEGFSLSVTYSASIGSFGSLVGSNANILLKAYADKSLPEENINFLTFFLYGLPICLVMIIIEWIILCLLWLPIRFCGFRSEKFFRKYFNLSISSRNAEFREQNLKEFFEIKLKNLGPWR